MPRETSADATIPRTRSEKSKLFQKSRLAKLLSVLREGLWLQEEGEELESFPVLDEFTRSCSPSPYVSQGFTTEETIASLSQKLTPDTEENMIAEDNVNMAEASGETRAEGQDEGPNEDRIGPSGENKGKGLKASHHAPDGEGRKGIAKTGESVKWIE